MDFFARVTTGFWPVICAISATAGSITLAFWVASPTPMLTTTFSSLGAAIGLVRPSSFIRAGRSSSNSSGAVAPMRRCSPWAAPACEPASAASATSPLDFLPLRLAVAAFGLLFFLLSAMSLFAFLTVSAMVAVPLREAVN